MVGNGAARQSSSKSGRGYDGEGWACVSNEVTNSAYRTRLGNPTAKAVLVVLADAADAAGYGWPSVERVAGSSELNLRTVRRMLQIFEEINLVARQRVEGKFYKYAFQINLRVLGTDLKQPFAARFRLAQRQPLILDAEEVEAASVELFADAAAVKVVCETASVEPFADAVVVETVCETEIAVCETEPPHPHIGGTIIEPPWNLLAFPGETVAPAKAKRKAKAPIRAKANATAPADPRHTPFRLAIVTYAKFKDVVLAWDGSEARALSLLLQSAPGLTLERFQACLNHRARSPGTPHGERPRLWLSNITKYQDGPLNQFGKTGDIHGTFKGKTESSLDAAQQAIAVIASREASGYYAASGQAGRSAPGQAGHGRLLGAG
jgi:hypothetical protein